MTNSQIAAFAYAGVNGWGDSHVRPGAVNPSRARAGSFVDPFRRNVMSTNLFPQPSSAQVQLAHGFTVPVAVVTAIIHKNTTRPRKLTPRERKILQLVRAHQQAQTPGVANLFPVVPPPSYNPMPSDQSLVSAQVDPLVDPSLTADVVATDGSADVPVDEGMPLWKKAAIGAGAAFLIWKFIL